MRHPGGVKTVLKIFHIPDLISGTESVGWNIFETETNLEIFSWKQ